MLFPKKEAGFTLLELILVVSLVAGIMLFLSYKVNTPKPDSLLMSAESAIAKAFEIGRMQAVLKKIPVPIALHPQTNQIIVGNEVFFLPKGISLERSANWTITAKGLIEEENSPSIRLFTTGQKPSERFLTVTKTAKVFSQNI